MATFGGGPKQAQAFECVLGVIIQSLLLKPTSPKVHTYNSRSISRTREPNLIKRYTSYHAAEDSLLTNRNPFLHSSLQKNGTFGAKFLFDAAPKKELFRVQIPPRSVVRAVVHHHLFFFSWMDQWCWADKWQHKKLMGRST